MTLPSTATVVLYPAGTTASDALVLHVEPLADGRAAVLLDRTPCHPVDAGWPDQGPDRAVLVSGDASIEVLDCIVAATDGSALFIGSDIPVRTGSDGWVFAVAHVVDAAAAPTEGDRVAVEVDPEFRTAVSAGHTGCHLASLALNAALATAWSKDATPDGLGSPDFDATAIDTSTILEYGSRDVYRIGKSVRKRGFDPSALADPAAVAETANAILASWLSAGGDVTIERDGDLLTDRRYWVAALTGASGAQIVRIPCGGTHASSLAELGTVSVALEAEQLDGAIQLTMSTRVG